MIKKKTRMLRNWVTVFWSIIRVRLGFGYSEEPIPSGPYCYELIESRSDSLDFKVRYCPYYRPLSGGYTGCKYLGMYTDDFVFEDSCKICSIKKEFPRQGLSPKEVEEILGGSFEHPHHIT
jgi:hypothetical protein